MAWPEYPFCKFKLKAKSKKSVFVQMRTECEFGLRPIRNVPFQTAQNVVLRNLPIAKSTVNKLKRVGHLRFILTC